MNEPSMNGRKTIVDAALLRDFVDGKLDAKLEAKVAAFVEQHPSLISKVEAMSSGGFMNRLRSAYGVELGRSLARTPAVAKEDVPERVPQEPHENPSKPVAAPNIPQELSNLAGYEILKELGRGGMGVVYLAKNITLDRLEVLKVLNDRLHQSTEAKERFIREVRAVSRLSHPAIVTSYSVLPSPSAIVFAMEYVEGMDLHKFVHRNTPMPIAMACSIVQQVASGLQHGHERGLVHRDIKPSNIMIYRDGNKLAAKILDFGLAKPTAGTTGDGLTNDGTMLGTPEYVSPEQMLNAAKSDIRSDIYSLGCTLYHLLVGHPPFRGTIGEVMMAHAQSEAPMVHVLRSDVPIELSEIVGRMMSKDPALRFHLPSAVAIALRPFVAGNPKNISTELDVSAAPLKGGETVVGLASPNIDTSVEVRPSHNASFQSLDGNSSSPKPMSSKRWNGRFRVGLIIATILLAFSGLSLLGIILIRTSKGTLQISNLPEDALIIVDDDKVTVKWNEERDTVELSLKPGVHQVEVRRGDTVIQEKEVKIDNGQSQKWTVSYSEEKTPQPVERVALMERLIGVWQFPKPGGAFESHRVTADGVVQNITKPNDLPGKMAIRGEAFTIKWSKGYRTEGTLETADRLACTTFDQNGKLDSRWKAERLISEESLEKPSNGGIDLAEFFPTNSVFEGDWSNFPANSTKADGFSKMTVRVTGRTNNTIKTEWELHTWDGKWRFRGEISATSEGKVVFNSTDATKIDGKPHANEGNTYLFAEFSSNGKAFSGTATYKSGRRSDFQAKRVDVK